MSTETLDITATIAEMKTVFDRFIGILVKAERRLSNLMDMSIRAPRREEQENAGKKNTEERRNYPRTLRKCITSNFVL